MGIDLSGFICQSTLRSYESNMHVEGLPHVRLYLVSLFNSEQCLQVIRFRHKHVPLVNTTSSYETKLIDSNAEASRVNRNTL